MPLLSLLFVLSGAAGLIYESVWARYLSLLVGHSAYAQVIVLVIFLGGMAIGSMVAGRWSERIESPLLWYAIVEIVIAIIAAVFHSVFVGATDAAYTRWLPGLSPGIGLSAATWSLAAALILPQSILLGATFPLMSAGAIRLNQKRTGRSLGILYFSNSFGAALGALVGGFVLIGATGMQGTLWTAAILNLIVAAGVFVGFVRFRPHSVVLSEANGLVSPAEVNPFASLRATKGWTFAGRVLLAVSFLTAFSSFLYEIAWIRMLSLVHGSATHSFELMLSAFILGLAFGALWISRRADDEAQPLRLLGQLQWAMGLAAIATLPLYVMSFDWTVALLSAVKETDTGYRLYSAARYVMTLVIMLPATFFAGTTLPLITRMLLTDGAGERAIGAVYGVNTIGSILGAAAAALLLVPLIGLKWVLIGGGLIDIAVGVALLVWNDRLNRSAPVPRGLGAEGRRSTALIMTLAVIGTIAFLTPFAPERLASGVYRYGSVPGSEVFRYLFYRDGRTASVSVRQLAGDTNSLITISTNGKPDASMSPAWARPVNPADEPMLLDQDMSTQLLLPLLVLAHAPSAKHGAVIGQGSGITSHILLTSPTLERLHTIEIEPEMIRGSRVLYPGNKRVFDDPRSTFAIDDARAFLAASGPAFDFVVSEPSNPWVSGVSGLFTIEFYARVKSRLRPGGVFAQWFHLYEMDDETVASVMASIDRVFGDYRVYLSSNADVVIVAANGPTLGAADWSVTRFPELAADLRHFPPLGRETLDATVVGGRETFGPYLRRMAINSDFHPLLDLNGERLRFRKVFATGFREVAEARMDIPAVLENRRRGFGTVTLNPAPEIFRAAALSRGASFRATRDSGGDPASSTDGPLRRGAYRLFAFERGLSLDTAPSDWTEWLAEFANAEVEIHGGTAGVADERFYGATRRYLEGVRAPAGVKRAVDFYHGLAAWDFAEVVEAGSVLIVYQQTGKPWVPAETLRRGMALARIREGDLAAAQKVYTSLVMVVGPWSLSDLVLEAWIESRLPKPPARQPPDSSR